MINTTDVLDAIIRSGLVSIDEHENLVPYCTAVCSQLSQRLKSEDFAENPCVIMACASITLYNFLLANGTTDDFLSFKAGDITVKHNREARIENAAKLKSENLVLAAPYLTDISFVFEAVEV